MTSPETAFVTAIIMQAYRDLFVNVNTGSGPSFTTRCDQDQAIAFLTDQTGQFAAHRNHLCSLIGWDGNVLAARVRRMMDGDDFPIANGESTPTAQKRHKQLVESLRQRYRHLKNPHSLPASSVGHPQVA
jgi:hypothetical protein